MSKLMIQLRNVAVLAALLAMAAPGCSGQPAAGKGYHADSKRLDRGFTGGTDRPPTPRTLRALSRILSTQAKDPEAQFVLNRTIRSHPKFAPAYADLAELQMRHDNVDDAMETLRVGLEQVPAEPILINNVGMCWLLKAEYEKAAEQFEYASMLDPKNGRYLSNLATAQGMAGDYEAALATFEHVVLPEDAHYNLAVICESRGDEERASEEYRIARRLKLERLRVLKRR